MGNIFISDRSNFGFGKIAGNILDANRTAGNLIMRDPGLAEQNARCLAVIINAQHIKDGKLCRQRATKNNWIIKGSQKWLSFYYKDSIQY